MKSSRGARPKSVRATLVFAVVVILGWTCQPAQAKTINVPTDQPTIQAAIDVAANGDTVLVAPGTYTENINFNGKGITVTSSAGPQTTVIDGGQHGSVVTFNSGEGLVSVLNGFTIQNGFPTAPPTYDGGGILISGASPTVTNNIITNNQACDGAGIAIFGGSPLVQGNTITQNKQGGCSGGTDGGGILIQAGGSAQIISNIITNNTIYFDGGGIGLFAAGTPTIKNNLISGNSATDVGGGISMVNGSAAIIVQNLIVANSASQGGGIYWLGGSGGPILVNNTIAGNISPSGSALFSDGSSTQTLLINNIVIGSSGQNAVACSTSYGSLPQVKFSDVFSPSASPYDSSCGPDQTGTNGNISADPLFFDPANNNFQIQFGSPVIDEGTNSAPNLPSSDFDGNPRIQNGVVDMGAYEFFPATMSVSATNLIFSPTPFGTSSPTQTLKVTNTGSTKLLLDIALSGDFTQANNCGNVVAAGLSCTITVTFVPTARGPLDGTLTLISNAPSGPKSISLTGTGIAPFAALSATSLNFGSQLQGTTSAPQTVTLSNTGDIALTFSNISVSSDFSQSNSCTSSIAVGSSCTVSVTFTPSAAGQSVGTLTLTDNAPGTPQTVTLMGTGFIYAVPQIDLPLVPDIARPGGSAFTLTINGSGFASASVVNWNGSARSTTFVNATQLTATIPASDIATVGTTLITVVNPTPGGGKSNAAAFQIATSTPTLTFAKSDSAVGPSPQFIAEGDFNGDGKLDFAVTNSGSNTVSILLGKGDGTFQAHVDYPTGLDPDAIAVGDFNKDGKLDLAIANISCPPDGGTCSPGTISILLGNGDGTFQPQRTFGVESVPLSIAVGDFNGDGMLDLAVGEFGNIGGVVTVFLGNGDGTFKAGVDYPVSQQYSGAPVSLIAGDFNGDGILDLAASNGYSSDNISVLLGNGDGTFQAPVEYLTGPNPYMITAGDFNHDGKLDLAVADNAPGANTVSILLGNGDGTFQSHVDYATGISPYALTTADLNGDSKLDLVVADLSANSVSVLLGNGDGTFQAYQSFPVGVGPYSVVSGDFNKDGRLDLAVADFGSNTVSVLLQAPTSTVSSTSLAFGNQSVGTHSTAQSITLNNTGSAPLLIKSIATSGDFAQTNTCGSSVAANVSCTITVTFAPTAVGPRTGTLTVTDNLGGSPQTIALTGTGVGAMVSLLATSLNFGNVIVGETSGTQTVTLKNTGNAALNVTTIAESGDFAATNNCGASVAANGSCEISITFKPTTGGSRTGTLTISDSAAGSPQTIALAGSGEDFSFGIASRSSASASVSQGGTATYVLRVSSLGGLNQAISFTCSGAPSMSTCSVSPGSLAAGSMASSVMVRVTTTESSMLVPPVGPIGGGGGWRMLVLGLAALFLVAFGWWPRRRTWPMAERVPRRLTTFAGVLLFVLSVAACGGMGGSTDGASSPGTPAGNYTLTVTGTVIFGSTTLAHTINLTLKVQ